MTGRRLAIAVTATLLVLAAILVSKRLDLAQELLVERARASGYSGIGFEVTSLYPTGATLERVELDLGAGAPNIEVGRVRLRFDPRSLYEGRLVGVDVEGLRLSLDLDETPGDADSDAASVAAAEAPEERFDLDALGELRLVGAEIELRGEVGRLSVSMDASAVPATGGAIDFTLDLIAKAVATGGEASESIEVAAQLQGNLGPRGDLRLAPRDCVSLALPAALLGGPLEVTSPQSLCLRSDGVSLLKIPDALGNPGRLELSAMVDRFEVAGDLGDSKDPNRIAIELAGVRVALDTKVDADSPGLRIESMGIRADAPDVGLTLDDVDLTVAFAFDPELGLVSPLPVAAVSSGRVTDLSTPQRFAPLELKGAIRPEANELKFEFDFTDAAHVVRGRVVGSHDPSSGVGTMTLNVDPLDLSSLDTRARNRFPTALATTSSLQGAVVLGAEASWSDAGIASDARVRLEGVGLSDEWGSASGIHADLALVGPSRWSMSEPQRLRIARLTAGTELSDIEIDLRLLPDGAVEIPAANWTMAGGSASTRGIYDPESTSQQLEITVAQVDLGALLELLDIDGLAGSGTLGGTFPLHIEGDAVEIRNAKLLSDAGGGTLRYRPTGAASATAAQSGELGLVVELLENFQYEQLVVVLNGRVDGDVEAAIHLAGANPDFQDGFPVEYNLNVDAPFGGLFSGLTAPFRVIERFGNAAQRKAPRDDEEEAEPIDGQGRQTADGASLLDASEPGL